MRMLCRHVVLNFRPRRPLSTFNITSSSTFVTTATLPAAHVSTKAGAGEAAGVAGQAVASIQWFLSWFHIKKTRRLQQLVRQIGFKTLVYGSWRLCALVTNWSSGRSLSFCKKPNLLAIPVCATSLFCNSTLILSIITRNVPVRNLLADPGSS